jgi:hypothetical protein
VSQRSSGRKHTPGPSSHFLINEFYLLLWSSHTGTSQVKQNSDYFHVKVRSFCIFLPHPLICYVPFQSISTLILSVISPLTQTHSIDTKVHTGTESRSACVRQSSHLSFWYNAVYRLEGEKVL